MWHTYHDRPYPSVANARVKVLLRACGRQDALTPSRPLKSAVQLTHLLILYHKWINGSEEDLAAFDCVIVAFWGMMRLAEVTYDHNSGTPAWINSILCEDVRQETGVLTSITLTVRGAKKAKAGGGPVSASQRSTNCFMPGLSSEKTSGLHGWCEVCFVRLW